MKSSQSAWKMLSNVPVTFVLPLKAQNMHILHIMQEIYKPDQYLQFDNGLISISLANAVECAQKVHSTFKGSKTCIFYI